MNNIIVSSCPEEVGHDIARTLLGNRLLWVLAERGIRNSGIKMMGVYVGAACLNKTLATDSGFFTEIRAVVIDYDDHSEYNDGKRLCRQLP